MENNPTRDWSKFYQATEGNPPREMLMKALSLFDAESAASRQLLAIDLGCGVGLDTLELLRRGWHVLAIDAQPEAIERLAANTPDALKSRLQTQVAQFEQLVLPEADFINAAYSIPFCAPDAFDALWGKITASIRSKGRFAGQFFGVHDSWAQNPRMNFHTVDEVQKYLSGFNTEYFSEEDKDGKTSIGESKHWHIFHIVARKL